MSGEKFNAFVKRHMGYIVVAITCAIYIALAFVNIGKTGKSIEQIIADGCISFLLGLFINRNFDLQGMMIGESDERMVMIRKLHGEAIENITDNIDQLDDWCLAENLRNYRRERTLILANAGLKYEKCFDEKGVALPYEVNTMRLKNKYSRKDELHKLATFKRAVNLKLTPITAGDLTSEGGKSNDAYYLGRTKREYEKEVSRKNIINKLVIGILIGYFGVEFIQDVNWARVIWNSIQVAIFVIMGTVQMYETIQFITTEYHGRIAKKIDNLDKFNASLKSGGISDGKD